MAKHNPHPKEPSPNKNPIISLDPSTPLHPVPLIADILRTRYCVPGSIFLVESIESNISIPEVDSDDASSDDDDGIPPTGGGMGMLVGERERRRQRRRHRKYRARPERTVRLILGDRELCMQAFVKGEIHGFVDGGNVYEGCYVRVDKFWVGAVEVDDEGGVNEEYLGILVREKEEEEKNKTVGDPGIAQKTDAAGEADTADITIVGGDMLDPPDEAEEYENDEIIDQLMAVDESDLLELAKDIQAESEEPKSEKTAPEEDFGSMEYISDSDSAFEKLAISAERATQRRADLAARDPREDLQAAIIEQNKQDHKSHAQVHPPHQETPQPPQKQQPQHPAQPPRRPHPPVTKPRPWLPTTAANPVKLTLLSQIAHLPYRQNWMVNVLAVLFHLGPVEPSHIGPSFRQRTARIADFSTPPPANDNTSTTAASTALPKGMLLTVYLDPDEFTPREGTVVLLLGVKNHYFEGASLRKYVSDGLEGGEKWWVGEPGRLKWCREGVQRLERWWRMVEAGSAVRA
ncbi:uncharacterized protein C8A04DRAFT_14274 [Dichotomopilus funicola]|uniref:Uncharacterized protein n=1 Tax=Dichotomopilus funicola TaxID=1934379 RepID=A0AAN6V0C2_9PEZI|nr:hypothetical protein C8A04DRAFT_14274 [Dichotomopilus funicola]